LPRGDSAGLLFKVAIAVVATLALLVVWRPAFVHAQQAPVAAATDAAPTTTHVVKAGETLWSLAARYYGDGHQWKELARRNGIEGEGPTALRVGQVLNVPERPQTR